MTNPQNPTTANNVLQRVEALLPELPAHAEVTLDFSRYPIPDVPYLTVEKWALSSDQDWPLLTERRDNLDMTTATRGLSDDEVRNVLYDDLRRSLWRALPDGPSLTWDDQQLRLTVSWSPTNPSPQASQTFATLAGPVNTSQTDLVDATPDSAAAFRQAINDAAQPPQPSGPAFRVNIGNVNLPAGNRYPGHDNDERTARLYHQFKQKFNKISTEFDVEPDPHVRFNDDKREVEFDTINAIFVSGLHDAMVGLARLPQFGEPPRHDGGPERFARGHRTAEAGVRLRLIEHAFAVPGYREHRQAGRRAVPAGLTYDIIAKAYQHYDQHFTSDRKEQLSRVLTKSRSDGKYFETFQEFFRLGGLVIGEDHNEPDAYQFVTRNMADMRRAGLTAIVCEHFDDNDQQDVDDFVMRGASHMSPGLQKLVQASDRDRCRSDCDNPVEEFLCEARKNQIRVLAAEHPAAYFAAGAGRITAPGDAYEYDREKRRSRYNWMATAADANHRPTDGQAVLHITGGAHVHTSERGYPGIAQLAALPAVVITRIGDALYPLPIKEEPERRMTKIPEHAGTSSTPQSMLTSRARQTWALTHSNSAPQHRLHT